MRGRAIELSLPRRMVIDLLHFAKGIPSVPVQRQMSLARLAAARAACQQRPRWTAIFAKAYTLVACEFPELRRSYIKTPWPRLYEYPASIANVIVERDYQGEPCLFSILINDVDKTALPELARLLEYAETAPIDEIKVFRRALKFMRLPSPLRRTLWWLMLNIGRYRATYIGTFSLSVYSALNAESLHPLTPLTTLLNYGVISSGGNVCVRIIYDHRVMDGATVARILARLEEILNSAIAEELELLAAAQQKTNKPDLSLAR
jgi:hypothetical protein